MIRNVRIYASLIVMVPLLGLLLYSCFTFKGEHVDLIVHNAKIHTLDKGNTIVEAMAIRDGKIVESGPERQILNRYTADESINAGGKHIYPGLTDAHGHLLSLMEQRLNLDLTGCKSRQEMIFKVEKYGAKQKRAYIIGRGWDQSLWSDKQFPDCSELDRLFPNIPVLLYRVDGHAALANSCLMRKANITAKSRFEGGEVQLINGVPSGILLDNAIEAVSHLLPEYSLKEKKMALLEIQEELFQYGITGVHEAGINFKDIELFKQLYESNKFNLYVYAMLYPTPENQSFAKKNGHYFYRNLSIRSFKVVGDGALGSRGACLKQPYSDALHTHGFLTTSKDQLKQIALFAQNCNYQMNTHAIGDSTNKILLDLMKEIYTWKKDHRWRIEHAQVLDPEDIKQFGNYGVLPSVQPTHAISDQRWAGDRLGKERLKGAYAYRSILESAGMLALGTDFPVESFDPFKTIHAAVQRSDDAGNPTGGFLPDEAITIEQCLMGMTIWPATAAFQEEILGSLEKDKHATFVVMERPIRSELNYQPNFATMTFIKGKKVYSAE